MRGSIREEPGAPEDDLQPSSKSPQLAQWRASFREDALDDTQSSRDPTPQMARRRSAVESLDRRSSSAHDNVLVNSEHFSAPLEMPTKSGMPPRRQGPAPQGTPDVEKMMLECGMKVHKTADGQLHLKQGDVDQLVSDGVLPAFKASALIYCPLEPCAMVSSISFSREGYSYTLSGRKLEALRKASARMQDFNGLVAFELPDRPMVKLTRRDVTNLCHALGADAQAGLLKSPPSPPPQAATLAASSNSQPKMLYKPGRKAHVGEQLARPLGRECRPRSRPSRSRRSARLCRCLGHRPRNCARSPRTREAPPRCSAHRPTVQPTGHRPTPTLARRRLRRCVSSRSRR